MYMLSITYNTKELRENERPTYSPPPLFVTAPLEIVALTTSRIYLMIHFIDNTNKVGQKQSDWL